MSTLQAMELFVWSVRRGSFSGAARRAGLSPASVSRVMVRSRAMSSRRAGRARTVSTSDAAGSPAPPAGLPDRPITFRL